MNKVRQLDLSETNIAGLGTDLEKKVRLSAAETEKAWEGVGKKPGLRVWRIEQFKVVAWPEAQYGSFHTGDSYIVLNTYKKPNTDALLYDVHFWLGLETTQDEAGTAAYKTVELDDFLRTSAVQHREVQGAESMLFLSYFKFFTILEGGTNTGFRHVEQEKQFTPRLLHIYTLPSTTPCLPGKKPAKTLIVKQVPATTASLNSGDVFVLDGGKEIWQWNGAESAGMERNKAAEYVRKLDDERKGASVTVFDEREADTARFYAKLGGTSGPIASAAEGAARLAKATSLTDLNHEKALFRLSNAGGELKFSEEAKGKVKMTSLDGNDVFVFDCGVEVFVWVGKATDAEERKKSLQYALEYIKQNDRPPQVPVTRLLEGAENQIFLDAFDL
ncbi:uncharacterized protein EV422DRAFT_538417 [Fimicolochytrium jonesii]|uniref:uncharacterized protein n=1 Tax=Fimicolochytrium jonesii TaxID=1396493 RepID=UPI0022FEF5BB|nr:uncharacterized protein EV422DRAFT_538417 [Fimicolochytrium jonesii]KAI8818389.1 hypothetical protein EV422DRAFT_538417 [Fimicolochytrium jonesii]